MLCLVLQTVEDTDRFILLRPDIAYVCAIIADASGLSSIKRAF